MKKDFTFKFLNQTYSVKFVDKIDLDDKESWGLTDTDKGEIELLNELEGLNLIRVFYHELGHVLLSVCESSIPNHEEMLCNLIGEGLTTILPQLPKYLR